MRWLTYKGRTECTYKGMVGRHIQGYTTFHHGREAYTGVKPLSLMVPGRLYPEISLSSHGPREAIHLGYTSTIPLREA